MPLFLGQLTTIAILWFLAIVYLKLLLDIKLPQSGFSTFFVAAALGFTTVMGYETYVVSRALAIGLVAYYFFEAILFRKNRINSCFIILGVLIGAVFLHYLHPELEIGLKVLKGDGESIIKHNGNLNDNSWNAIFDRIKEYKIIFHNPNYHYFSAWWPASKTTGWSHFFISALFAILLFVVQLLRKGSLGDFKSKYPTVILFLLAITFMSLIVPLGSTTGVRGHRLFGFYISSMVLLALLWNRFAQGRLHFLLTAQYIFAAFLFFKQLAVIYNYEPDKEKIKMAKVNYENAKMIRVFSDMKHSKEISNSEMIICDTTDRHTDGYQFL